jgi:hypothetical protein
MHQQIDQPERALHRSLRGSAADETKDVHCRVMAHAERPVGKPISIDGVAKTYASRSGMSLETVQFENHT